MKKFIAIIMAVIMVMSFATIAFAANGFTDVPKSRYEAAINELYDLGIVNGYSTTKFGTDYTLTRAEACAIIVRALYGGSMITLIPLCIMTLCMVIMLQFLHLMMRLHMIRWLLLF